MMTPFACDMLLMIPACHTFFTDVRTTNTCWGYDGKSSIFFAHTCLFQIQPGAVKLVLCALWMHLNCMHPVTSENQLHCTRLCTTPLIIGHFRSGMPGTEFMVRSYSTRSCLLRFICFRSCTRAYDPAYHSFLNCS